LTATRSVAEAAGDVPKPRHATRRPIGHPTATPCSEVEAVNRLIEALPPTTSCAQLMRQIRAHCAGHADRATALVLLGDRSDAAPDDSPAAVAQVLATLRVVDRWPVPKRLLCENAHHAGPGVVAREAASRGIAVLPHDHGIDRALRGAIPVLVTGWRRAAAWHQALAHTHATVGVVLVAPLAPDDVPGARCMGHLLSAPGLLKIRPVDASIGELSH